MIPKDPRDLRLRDQLLLPWSPGRSISTARAADILDVSQTTVRAMIEDGTLMGYKIRPNRKNSPYRVFRDSLIKHLRSIRRDLDLPEIE